MWDTVENKFYRNKGTGQFTLGNKITLKEYEYLESSGTQWIDTGISMSSDVGASMQYEMTVNEQGDYCLLGVGDDRFRWGFEIYIGSSNKNYVQTAGLAYIGNSWQNYQCSSLTTYNILYNYSNDQNVFLNGTSIRTGLPTGNLNIGNIYMFGFNYGGDSGNYEGKGTLWRGAKAKIYSCQITKNGVIVRDFIPVSYNGTPGLWDKVEWKFYANAGSGSFTLGPEIAVQQNAPIFYDSSGYCNHGSITGTLTTNSDTPRYINSIQFGSDKLISTTASGPHILTMSIWAKDAGSTPSNGLMFKDHLGDMALGIQNGILYSGKTDGKGAGSTSISAVGYTANTWHHWVMVNRNNTFYVYMDGQQVLSGTSGKWDAGTVTNALHIGGRSGSSPWPGKLSDFRAYVTALSEEDILELYNTSAFVTNNGVFAEYELYEDNLSDVKKRGLLETANFYENGAESGYALDTDKTRVASNYIISEEFIEI